MKVLLVISEWFEQGISLPILGFDILFFALGIVLAMGMKKETLTKTIVFSGLAYFATELIARVPVYIISTAGIFIGAALFFLLAGLVLVSIIRRVKENI